jgi:hypothetical protein
MIANLCCAFVCMCFFFLFDGNMHVKFVQLTKEPSNAMVVQAFVYL